jgi:hypothetical protein
MRQVAVQIAARELGEMLVHILSFFRGQRGATLLLVGRDTLPMGVRITVDGYQLGLKVVCLGVGGDVGAGFQRLKRELPVRLSIRPNDKIPPYRIDICAAQSVHDSVGQDGDQTNRKEAYDQSQQRRGGTGTVAPDAPLRQAQQNHSRPVSAARRTNTPYAPTSPMSESCSN